MLRLLADENLNGDILNDRLPIGRAIEAVLLLVECTEQAEWIGRAVHVPL
jgi:hypothetical protein